MPYLNQAMKKLLASCLLTFALLAAMPQLVLAQESNPRQYGTLEGQQENQDFEATSEGEPLSTKPLVSKQDSIFSRNAVKKTTDPLKTAPKKNNEDEAPFNFLYYIIQRFKTSDIIED